MSDLGMQPAGVDPVRQRITVQEIFAPTAAAPQVDKSITSAAPDFWIQFGCQHLDGDIYRLAPGAIALRAEKAAHAALVDFTKQFGVPPHIAMHYGDGGQSLYHISDTTIIEALTKRLPEGVSLIREGETIALPRNWEAQDGRATAVCELSELTAAAIGLVVAPQADPLVTSNPLLPFSLRGQSERFKRLAVEARPLLGDVCLRGQVTVWYAAPGTGKTLIALSLVLDAVREDRIPAGNIFYVNADDNGQGFATKLQIMDDIGSNTLSPGIRGFNAPDLIEHLHAMAEQNEARGVLIIIDTIKKFASLMDKRESSEFAQACRRVAMMGGTVLGLAHTTKTANADGTPRYAGTTDLVDDADAAYTLKLVNAGGDVAEKVVEFTCFKSRGDCAETAAYAFAVGKGIGYEEMLASVRSVDPIQLNEFQRIEAERSDAEIIDVVSACIADGVNTKMLLAKEVAARTNISARAAGRLIERYSGDDPIQHRWRFNRGERGAQIFTVLPPPAAPA